MKIKNAYLALSFFRFSSQSLRPQNGAMFIFFWSRLCKNSAHDSTTTQLAFRSLSALEKK
jgi:hypothetical protein